MFSNQGLKWKKWQKVACPFPHSKQHTFSFFKDTAGCRGSMLGCWHFDKNKRLKNHVLYIRHSHKVNQKLSLGFLLENYWCDGRGCFSKLWDVILNSNLSKTIEYISSYFTLKEERPVVDFHECQLSKDNNIAKYKIPCI